MTRILDPGKYRAALYIRLSREDDNDGPSQSITNQQGLLEAFAEEQHLPVHDIYIDDGWSGTNFDRPGFQKMIGDIEAGRVNLVVTKDLSRLGRDYILTGHYMERYFPEHRVRYISLLDGIDTGIESPANDITPFRAIMNDMYAKDISRKIKSVKREKQRRGLFIGGKPCYGYRMHPTEKNRIVMDEAVVPVVRRIFALALEGVSCRRIAGILNAEGIPAPSVYCGWQRGKTGPYAGLWSSERISEMLRNEVYIGNMVQGRMAKISYKSPKCLRQPRENWVVVEDTHEAIIDGETFRRVGRQLDSRKQTRSRTYDFLLKGLIFCRECGYPLGVLNRKTKSGEDRLYFVCRTYQRFTAAGVCTCHCVQEQAVRLAVTEKIQELCAAYGAGETWISLARDMIREAKRQQESSREKERLNTEVAALTAHMDQLYMDRLAGILAEQDFHRIYEKLSAQRDKLEEQLRRQEQREDDCLSEENLAEEWTAAFWETFHTRREILVRLIGRVELSQEKQIHIRLRFPRPDNLP